MKRKPMTIDSIMPAVTETAAPKPAEPVSQEKPTAGQGAGQRASVKQQTVYLPHAVHRQLRALAFHEEVSMHTLIMEGLDRVFRDRGIPPVAELTGKS
jgi:hypothetical protein